MMSIVMLMMSLLVLEVTAYPGALCNVTYSIPVECGEVLARITDQVGDKLLHKIMKIIQIFQMKLWDNTTSCAGDCEQVCTEKCKGSPRN